MSIHIHDCFLKLRKLLFECPSETSALKIRISDNCEDPVAWWLKPGNNLMGALCCTISFIIDVIWRETGWKSKDQERVLPRKDSPSWTPLGSLQKHQHLSSQTELLIWYHRQHPGWESCLQRVGGRTSTYCLPTFSLSLQAPHPPCY